MDTSKLPERIMNRIRLDGPIPAHAPHLGPCNEWQGALTKGYGKVHFQGQMTTAHRAVYKITVRDLTSAEHLDHLCLNKKCVNNSHLEVVTATENNVRAWKLVTHCKRGHPRIAGTKDKKRTCRECFNMRQNARYANDEAYRENRKRVERERARNNKRIRKPQT